MDTYKHQRKSTKPFLDKRKEPSSKRKEPSSTQKEKERYPTKNKNLLNNLPITIHKQTRKKKERKESSTLSFKPHHNHPCQTNTSSFHRKERTRDSFPFSLSSFRPTNTLSLARHLHSSLTNTQTNPSQQPNHTDSTKTAQSQSQRDRKATLDTLPGRIHSIESAYSTHRTH